MRIRLTRLATLAVAAALTCLAATPASASTLDVVYSIYPAGAATLAHPGAAPPGANDWSCHSSAHPRPVVLVHGTFANMTDNWNTLSPLLKNNGYCVFAFNYGGLIAGQVGGTSDIPTSGQQLSTFVDQVRAATGSAQVDLVGHSQGGMLPQYYVKFVPGAAAKVHTIAALAPDSHGTTVDGLATLVDTFPWFKDLISAACTACTQQLATSPFMRHLVSVPDTVPGVSYTIIASRYDAVVTPPSSQFLSGAGVHNIYVQDQCWNDFGDHVSMAFDHVALRDVLNALDPAHAQTPDCWSTVWPGIGG